jgi:hypothetical protein
VHPHTHAIPHHALYDSDVVCPSWRPVRDSPQTALPFLPLRRNHHALAIILDILPGPLQQLEMHSRRQRPRGALRHSGLVCREFETDEDAVA